MPDDVEDWMGDYTGPVHSYTIELAIPPDVWPPSAETIRYALRAHLGPGQAAFGRVTHKMEP